MLRDEVHLPFVPQGDAAKKCDARNDEQRFAARIINLSNFFSTTIFESKEKLKRI